MEDIGDYRAGSLPHMYDADDVVGDIVRREEEFIQAKRLNKDGSVDFTLWLRVETEITRGESIEVMVVRAFPISRTKWVGALEFVTTYPRSEKPDGLFDLALFHDVARPRAKFASRSDIFLSPAFQNCGVGSYMLSKLITWGAGRAPQYPVDSLHLSGTDAKGDNERDLRNHAYRRAGFELRFPDSPEEREGRAYASSLSVLMPGFNPDKISVHHPHDVIAELQSTNADLIYRNTQLKSSLESCVGGRDDYWHVEQQRDRYALVVKVLLVGYLFAAYYLFF